MPEKIAENIYKIIGDSNIYVFLKPEVFLIDASDNDYVNYVTKEIKKITDPRNVKKILLTHLHYDHVGNIDLFPNAELFAPKIDLDDFKIDPNLFFLYNLSDKAMSMLKNAKELPKFINGLEVFNVPGHTRGSVAFADQKNKLLFSGDCVFENGIGRTDFSNSEPTKMDKSVESLKDLIKKGYKLCSGHDY